MTPSPTKSTSHACDILRFAAEVQSAGKDVALCIVTHVTGGTLREAGAMMAVSEDGVVSGYISNGCVDGDISFQAKEALAASEMRALRYGEGSPFKDISLPCGGAIDLFIVPRPDAVTVQTVLLAMEGRHPVELGLAKTGRLHISPPAAAEMVFRHFYAPKIKLRIAGRGAAMHALSSLATAAGFDLLLQSPDRDDLAGSGDHLKDIGRPPDVLDDAWTAVVLLFHDHDWEAGILSQALSGPAFYIGAMGSVSTQAARIAKLKSQDIDASQIARIHGPIGLIPAMRDANLLALSILAEIVTVAQQIPASPDICRLHKTVT